MLKELFDKGKCALGFHAEAWSYVSDGSCEQASVCVRCHHESRRVLHVWRGWKLTSQTACEMARQCTRCSECETKIEHNWSSPYYAQSGSCEQIQRCARCGETTPSDTTHVWESWKYERDESCIQRLDCARCEAVGLERRVHHEWMPWQRSAFYDAPVRVCGAPTLFALATNAVALT